MTFQSLTDAKSEVPGLYHSTDTKRNLRLIKDWEAMKPSDVYYIFIAVAADHVALEIEAEKNSEAFKQKWKTIPWKTLRNSLRGTLLCDNTYSSEDMYDNSIFLTITNITAPSSTREERKHLMNMKHNIIDVEESEEEENDDDDEETRNIDEETRNIDEEESEDSGLLINLLNSTE